jgi:hypothetical protein
MAKIPLIVGATYYAGANLPFYVSRSMVTNYLKGKGFVGVRWHDREDPLPTTLDPTKDPSYDDDWDSWAEAQYQGNMSGVLDPPASPAWLRVQLPAAQSVISLPAAAPGTNGNQQSLTADVTRVAPVAIVVDPVLVRQRQLGVAATVVGGILVAWFGFGAIVKAPNQEVQR